MPDITNSALALRVNDMVSRWDNREKQMQDWLAGTATGGPYGDGRYPLSSSSGTVYYIKCPAALDAMVATPTGAAAAAQAAAEAAADEAETQAIRAEAARDQTDTKLTAANQAKVNAEAANTSAQAARTGAELARTGAETAETNAAASEAVAATKADDAAASAAEALASENAAATSASNAAASASAAATFDPANFYTKTVSDSRYRLTSVALTKADVGLGNADNTSDANKPVSTAAQTALNLKMDKAGGQFGAGITFAQNLASSATDLSKGIQLWAGYGFSITTNTLNYNVATAGAHSFNVNGAQIVRITNTTFTFNGNDVWNAGNFDPATKAGLTQPVFYENISVKNLGQTWGYAQLNRGGPSNTGYIAFFNAADVRKGYIGYADGTTITLAAEDGTYYNFINSVPRIGGSPILAQSDMTIANTFSKIVQRDSSGDTKARLYRSEFIDNSFCEGAIAFRRAGGVDTDNYVRFCNVPSAVNGWLGFAQTAALSDNPGWIKLPGGLTVMWGKLANVDFASGASATITFANGGFPTACLGIVGTLNGSNPNGFIGFQSITKTGATAVMYEYTPTAQAAGCFYIAIGY